MGTRNLTVVQYQNEYKVAQYCQWDGYPSGQGLTALRFARRLLDDSVRAKFYKKIAAVKWIDDSELENLWKGVGATSDFVPIDISNKFAKKYPYLHRNCGADVLEYVLSKRPGLKLQNSIEFANDGLFCEWVCLLNLDQGTFEAYSGFYEPAQKVSTSRFEHQNKVASWPLGNLPTDEEFLQAFGK